MIVPIKLIFRPPAVWRLAAFPLFAAAALAAVAETGGVNLVSVNAGTEYSKSASSRTPAHAFATAAGVYELDSAAGAVRFWQRAYPGKELMFLKGAPGVFSTGGEYRFTGKAAGGTGEAFRGVKSLAASPAGGRFAVLSTGAWSASYRPSVQVYDFEETADSAGRLSSLLVTNAVSYSESLFEYVASESKEVESVDYTYAKVGVSVTTNSVTTKYVYVIATEPELVTQEFETYENAYDVLDHDPQSGYVVGTCWPVEYVDVTTRDVYQWVYVTNFVTRYTYATNSYLCSATDVAFLGSSGLVASLDGSKLVSSSGGTESVVGVSGLLVFDLADPGAEAIVLPVSGLGGAIAGIDVDQDTGDVYAAVPSRSAVFKISSPGGSAESWLALSSGTEIAESDGSGGAPAWSVAAGEPGVSSSGFGYLARPQDVAVWTPPAMGEPLLMVAEGTATGRIAAFDLSSNAVFSASTPSGGTSLKNPAGVYGVPGEDVMAVADSGNGRTLLATVDFASVESDEILSVEPADFGATFSFRESDSVSNTIRFAVSPSRSDRTYTVTVAEDADGVLSLCSSEVVVAAGETVGSFAFFGLDGTTNALEQAAGETGSMGVLRIESAADSSFSADVAVEVLNVAPVITNAYAVSHLKQRVSIDERVLESEYGDMIIAMIEEDPELTFLDSEIGEMLADYITVSTNYVIDAFRIRVKDVVADFPMRYYWWATTNITWAMNNLYWAAEAGLTNAVWGEATDSAWTAVEPFEADLATTTGTVAEEVSLFAAAGRQVSIPALENGFCADFPTDYPATDDAYGYGMVVVATAIDKDGAASVITWPFGKAVTGQYRWVPTLDASAGPDDPSGGGGGDDTPAVYSAVFTSMSPTNLSFSVTHESGTPAATDTLSLHSATALDGDLAGWDVADNAAPTVFGVGADVLGDGNPVHEYEVELTPGDGVDAVFYTIQNP